LFEVTKTNMKLCYGAEFVAAMDADELAELFEPLLNLEYLLVGKFPYYTRSDQPNERMMQESSVYGIGFRTAAVVVAAALLFEPTNDRTNDVLSLEEGDTRSATTKITRSVSDLVYGDTDSINGMHGLLTDYAHGLINASLLKR
jgi:hypothetical protein